MKGKLVTMAVSFLLCVGMVGAGFASWVITNNVQENASGNIQVEQVVDKRLNLIVGEQNLDVFFGAPENPTTTNENPWLKSESAEKYEDLKATISVGFGKDNLAKVKGSKIKVEAKFTITPTVASAYSEAIEYNLISVPDATNLTQSQEFTATEEAWNYDFELSFNWGSYFNGVSGPVNPYNYFNDTFNTSSVEEPIVLPQNAQGNDIDGGTEVKDAGDCAALVLGKIYSIGSVAISVTITATFVA